MSNTTNTPAGLMQAFNPKIKGCIYMSDSDFENGTQAVYGKRIEIIESANDTTHEYSNAGEEPILFKEKTLQKAIESGYIEAHLVDLVLYDLITRRGILPDGDYFIRVSW